MYSYTNKYTDINLLVFNTHIQYITACVCVCVRKFVLEWTALNALTALTSSGANLTLSRQISSSAHTFNYMYICFCVRTCVVNVQLTLLGFQLQHILYRIAYKTAALFVFAKCCPVSQPVRPRTSEHGAAAEWWWQWNCAACTPKCRILRINFESIWASNSSKNTKFQQQQQ